LIAPVRRLRLCGEARRHHRSNGNRGARPAKARRPEYRAGVTRLGDVDQAANTAAKVRARTNGSDCEARGADPELVLGLLGERAGEGLGVARAVDGGFIAGHFAFLVHAAADPVERRAPPQQGKDEALTEGGEHVAAADVGVFGV
jgi:hypothetical protein